MELGFSLPREAWRSTTLQGPCVLHSFLQQAHPSPATARSILYEEEPSRKKQPILEGKLSLLLLLFSRSVVSDSFVTPWTVAHQAPLCLGVLQNPGVGCHCLLQGIFLTQGWNVRLQAQKESSIELYFLSTLTQSIHMSMHHLV